MGRRGNLTSPPAANFEELVAERENQDTLKKDNQYRKEVGSLPSEGSGMQVLRGQVGAGTRKKGE